MKTNYLDKLTKLIPSQYNLNLINIRKLTSVRSNLFLATTTKQKYIIKLSRPAESTNLSIHHQLSQLAKTSKTIVVPEYFKTVDQNISCQFENKLVTVSKYLETQKIYIKSSSAIRRLGAQIAEIHIMLRNLKIKIETSNFIKDYYFGNIPRAQSKVRLQTQLNLLNLHQPDCNQLTQGIIHNDLHMDNLKTHGKKIFLTDFEHIKQGPLISDLGVIMLDLWHNNESSKKYYFKLENLFAGYTKITPLSTYDCQNIVLFSIRYLYSDENWYNYWQKKRKIPKNPIKQIIKRQQLLIQSLK